MKNFRNFLLIFPGQGNFDFLIFNKFYNNCFFFRKLLNEILDIIFLNHNYLKNNIFNSNLRQFLSLTINIYLWRNWLIKINLLPFMVSGHSLGEYSALYCSGSLSIYDLINIILRRTFLMKNYYDDKFKYDIFAVIGLSKIKIKLISNFLNLEIKHVWIANFNSDDQIIVVVNKYYSCLLIKILNYFNVNKIIKLNINLPVHSHLMYFPYTKFYFFLKFFSFKSSIFPVLYNFQFNKSSNFINIPFFLSNQLYNSVLWDETLKYFIRKEIVNIVECGFESVLTNLIKKTSSFFHCFSLGEKNIFKSLIKNLN